MHTFVVEKILPLDPLPSLYDVIIPSIPLIPNLPSPIQPNPPPPLYGDGGFFDFFYACTVLHLLFFHVWPCVACVPSVCVSSSQCHHASGHPMISVSSLFSACCCYSLIMGKLVKLIIPIEPWMDDLSLALPICTHPGPDRHGSCRQHSGIPPDQVYACKNFTFRIYGSYLLCLYHFCYTQQAEVSRSFVLSLYVFCIPKRWTGLWLDI